jgi:large subunit ribosomal protein L2
MKLNLDVEKNLNKFLGKKLINGKKKIKSGRNNKGVITIRHRGGQVSRLFRILNLKYFFWNIIGIILKFVYDPNRNTPLMLVCYLNGILTYGLAIKDLKIGQFIFIGDKVFEYKKSIKNLTNFFFNFQNGSLINGLENRFLSGAKFVRSAGTVAVLLRSDRTSNRVLVRLPSKEERLFNSKCICTLGQIANINHFLFDISMAGRSRHLGIKSVVRGVAMNPVDHPHGGGQGKTSGAGGFRSQVTYKSKVAKGQPTRTYGKFHTFIVKTRKSKLLQ